jgi:Family of unknown function (DUF6350)
VTDRAEPRPGLTEAWWARPLRHGALAFAVLLGTVLAAAILGSLGPPTVESTLGRAALVPALIHRVPLEVGPVAVRAALLLGTAAAGALLYRGGRVSVAGSAVPPLRRASIGAAVAVPYAVGSFLLAVAALAASPSLGGTEVRPSIPWAVVVPLVLGGACGAAGALSAEAPASVVERRVRAVVAGGWRASWVAVALGSLGVLIVLALHPTAVRASVDRAFRRGPAEGSLTLLGAVLAVPNAGTGAAAAALGASIDVESGAGSCAVVSYVRFPAGEGRDLIDACPGLPFSLRPTPPGYLLFLIVPLVATPAGGVLAARRDNAASPTSATLVGVAAGGMFAAAFAGWCAAARVTAEVSGPLGTLLGGLGVSVGPDPLVGFLLALAWGAAGGAVGGWWSGREMAGPVDAGPARGDLVA